MADGATVAACIFSALAVLLFLPFCVTAFGFFPNSAFARRVYPDHAAILVQLRAQTTALTAIRQDVDALRETVDDIVDKLE
ncbi:hypothetical protein VTL71DRAFT_12327 [Oculimacula yallundae]|uniref:Uncharacterized protein n=1 Tax=Oculimacula yallundae TaxID=86028 RepID=A0ABR4CM98_9HELO